MSQTQSPSALPGDEKYAGRQDPILRLDLPAGPVYCALFPDAAPKHVERILRLAEEGFYNGQRFHRIVPNFVAQIGDPKSKTDHANAGSGGSPYGSLPLEVNRAYKNQRGTLAMARTSDPNSANSQFYIVLKDAPHLDMQYTVFGKVLDDGMLHVDKLEVGDPMDVFIVKK